VVISCSILVTTEKYQRNLERQSKHTHFAQRRFPKDRAVYEIMWGKEMVKPDRPQMTI